METGDAGYIWDSPTRTYEKLAPLPHQRAAINDVVKGLKDHDRGQMIMACGTGKTLTALWIAEKMDAGRILVLVPSLSLLRQTIYEWLEQAEEPLPFMVVCGDQTTAPGEDELVEHASDLGVPVTTDPDQIAGFMRKRKPRVVFATYASSPEIAAAQRLGRVPGFDLAIADEAHRCAGRVGATYTTVLSDKKIRAAKRLFMTATPRTYTPRAQREAAEEYYEMASMDDEERFGPVLHHLSFGEAVERDLLCGYRVVVAAIDESMQQQLTELPDLMPGKDLPDAELLGRQLTLLKAMREWGLRRVITFHSRVAGARQLAEGLPRLHDWAPDELKPDAELEANYVEGIMPANVRSQMLDRLRYVEDGQASVLANVRCLTEGVDVPAIDAIAFIDPRTSTVDIAQAIGRAIRKSEGKETGTIIIPVVVNEGDDPESILERSEFDRVWQVIRTLRLVDEQLAYQIDHSRQLLGLGEPGELSFDWLEIDMPGQLSKSLSEALRVRVVEQASSAWEQNYGRLLGFVQREGHAYPPVTYRDADGYQLGRWTVRQRKSHNQGKLSAERIAKLEALPGWTWDAFALRWEESFQRLEVYLAANGGTYPPYPYRDPDGYALGKWLSAQRAIGNQGKLPPERSARLEALPGWAWSVTDARWEEGYRRLEAYLKANDGAHPTQKHKEADGYGLGPWRTSQVVSYNRGKLSPERIARLEALPGWTWNTNDARWEEGYRRLKAYLKANDGIGPTKRHKEPDGYGLGTWRANQLASFREGKLSPERIARLEALPGWTWNALDAQWEEGYRRLKAYLKANDGAYPPFDYTEPDGYGLGSWRAHQRTRNKQGKLLPERIARLEALPGWSWSPHDAQFDDGYKRLVAYLDAHDGAYPHHAHKEPDGYQLGVWMSSRRAQGTQGMLSPERIARLEALPGWTWSVPDARWEEGYRRLKAYLKANDGNYPSWGYKEVDGYGLGTWRANQLVRFRNGKLAPERIAKLEALPGWWWSAKDARR